ncbi:hypothetical protein DFA_11428 [Cavenderia fasciculata]|uniref:Copper transport protein n=1 Tax=Cavenderia fasciculata TaxID=261658 RepID=F4QCY6_CACFS|nr:uncharacterized protein DFA_11428 [Cavenderia fasciculata]EGG13667.1 hypothetical protein DFA_11428 [Cavenderia fasciculata]|eukprot:XP_004350371.1 hypothetical protein DFA_11428 [Cavenderia fasciculata]
MYFHWSYSGVPIVFEGWVVYSPGLYAFSILMVFAICLFSEYWASYRHSLNNPITSETQPLINGTKKTFKQQYNTFLSSHYWKTIVHVIQYAINYFIMLVVMSFNAGLAFAVLGGIGVGYFMFGRRRVIIEEELCH